MIAITSTTLLLDGRQVRTYDTITLDQEIDEHHTLTAVFRMDAIEKDDSEEFGNETIEFLGKKIALQLETERGSETPIKQEFNGVISKVTLIKGGNTSLGDKVEIIGKSLTIMADDGPNMNSLNDITLEQIVRGTFANYPDIYYTVNPHYNGLITYNVQQNESSFDFVSRLSKQYGEWFYYDGIQVVFGKPENNPVELSYGTDLHSFQVSLAPTPKKFTFLSNNYLNDEILEESSNGDGTSGNQFHAQVSNSANNLFPNETIVSNNSNGNSDNAKALLNANVKLQVEANAARQIKLTGESSNAGVKIGNVIVVEGDAYRITKVAHTTNRNKNYTNVFEAISDNPEAYPLTDINAFPRSESQVGIVKDNQDPKSLGRIRVQFPWQKKKGSMTCWMRVATMQAGRSGGMFRIPHKEDEVIVNFENGNAEIPYTSGSLFNKNSPPPAGSTEINNYITIWQVGLNLITINEGDGSIEIKNKKESSIKLELNGDITFNANANINILALNGQVNINSPTINIGGECGGSKTDVTNIHGTNIHIHASQKLELLSDATLESKALKNTLEGTTSSDIKGAKVSVKGTTMTEITGGQVKLN